MVHAALNLVKILKAAIPGCESLTRTSDTVIEAIVVLKVGPVKARLGGKVTLDRSSAPGAMALNGESQGGVAGFASRGADVVLTAAVGGIRLSHTAHADVGAKIAHLGGRLIQGTAKQLSATFFENDHYTQNRPVRMTG